jgi:hypothetical protein
VRKKKKGKLPFAGQDIRDLKIWRFGDFARWHWHLFFFLAADLSISHDKRKEGKRS